MLKIPNIRFAGILLGAFFGNFLGVVKRRYAPDKRDDKNSRQSDCQLEMSPVTDEVRQQSQEHPRCCPEQLQHGAGKGTMYRRKQFARHHHPDKPGTLHTRHTP